jgi:hypothetical protein
MKEVDAHAGPFCLKEEKGKGGGRRCAGRYIVERGDRKRNLGRSRDASKGCHVGDLFRVTWLDTVLSPFCADTEVEDVRRVIREKGTRR